MTSPEDAAVAAAFFPPPPQEYDGVGGVAFSVASPIPPPPAYQAQAADMASPPPPPPPPYAEGAVESHRSSWPDATFPSLLPPPPDDPGEGGGHVVNDLPTGLTTPKQEESELDLPDVKPPPPLTLPNPSLSSSSSVKTERDGTPGDLCHLVQTQLVELAESSSAPPDKKDPAQIRKVLLKTTSKKDACRKVPLQTTSKSVRPRVTPVSSSSSSKSAPPKKVKLIITSKKALKASGVPPGTAAVINFKPKKSTRKRVPVSLAPGTWNVLDELDQALADQVATVAAASATATDDLNLKEAADEDTFVGQDDFHYNAVDDHDLDGEEYFDAFPSECEDKLGNDPPDFMVEGVDDYLMTPQLNHDADNFGAPEDDVDEEEPPPRKRRRKAATARQSYKEELDEDGQKEVLADEAPLAGRRRRRGRPRKNGVSKTNSPSVDDVAETEADKDLGQPNNVPIDAMSIESYVVSESLKLPRGKGKTDREEVKNEEEKADEEEESVTTKDDEGSDDSDSDNKPLRPAGSAKGQRLADRRIYGCMYCSFTGRKQMWVDHLKRRHRDDRQLLFCTRARNCNMPFTCQEQLDRHAESQHRDKYSCRVCGKEYKFPSMLRQHEQTHPELAAESGCDRQLYVCQYCGKKYQTRTGYRSHEAHQHTRANLRHKCTYEGCEKSFFNGSDLVIHERVHTGELPYVCSYCGVGFISKPRLVQHEKAVHLGTVKMNIECTICKKVVRKKYLSFHIKTHQGLNKAFCSVCGKEFPTIGGKRRHEKIHFADKQHACKFCGKAFVQKANKESHERIHTGEKPFPCKHCGERFVQQTRRNQHQNNCRQRPTEFGVTG